MNVHARYVGLLKSQSLLRSPGINRGFILGIDVSLHSSKSVRLKSIPELKLALINICDYTSIKIFCLWLDAIFNSKCASYEQCATEFGMIISLAFESIEIFEILGETIFTHFKLLRLSGSPCGLFQPVHFQHHARSPLSLRATNQT